MRSVVLRRKKKGERGGSHCISTGRGWVEERKKGIAPSLRSPTGAESKCRLFTRVDGKCFQPWIQRAFPLSHLDIETMKSERLIVSTTSLVENHRHLVLLI
jgi:hypothetical protein